MKRKFSVILIAALAVIGVFPPATGTAAEPAASTNVLGDVVMTEVCFNPTFRENNVGLATSADVLEFFEICNRSEKDVDLKDWTAAYSKEGYDGTFSTCPVFQNLPEGAYSLGAGETAVLAIVDTQVTTAGYGYATAEEFAALHAFFCDLYDCGDALPLKNFYILPRVESGSDTRIKGRFNLDNASKNAVLSLRNAEGTVMCEATYDASYWNRNGYALNLMYTGQVQDHPLASEAFNVSKPTPGILYENQIVPDASGLIAAEGTDTLHVTLMEYNICATDEQGEGIITSERAEEVCKVIDRHDPDVMLLCEVNHLWIPFLQNAYTGEQGVYDAYGFSSQGMEYSGKQLDNIWDLYNLILWKRDQYTLVDAGHFWCADKTGSPSCTWSDGTVGDFNRCINWVILEDKQTGAQFFVLCQHIDAKVAQARLYSAQLIAQKATELSRGLPVLMSGDWNANDSSEPYKALLASGEYADARYRTVSPDRMTVYGSSNKWGVNDALQSRSPIDLCILSKADVFVDSVTMDVGHYGAEEENLFASDHNATVYELNLLIKTTKTDETESNQTETIEPESGVVESTPPDTSVETESNQTETIEPESSVVESTPPDTSVQSTEVDGSVGTDDNPQIETEHQTEGQTGTASGGCSSVTAFSSAGLLAFILLLCAGMLSAFQRKRGIGSHNS